MSSPTCYRCDRPAVDHGARPALCVIHYRFRRMRQTARERGLAVPPIETLERLAKEAVARGMVCPCCRRVMHWGTTVDKSLPRGTTLSLQHDRSGDFRFICVSCNKSHSAHPGDTFYELPAGHKQCGKCRVIKPFAQFHKNRLLFRGVSQSCKSCAKVINARRTGRKQCV